MIRLLLVSCGALLLGSFGAFFLMVSMLSIATVVSMLVGLMLMFALGLQVGTRQMARISDHAQSPDGMRLLPPQFLLRPKD